MKNFLILAAHKNVINDMMFSEWAICFVGITRFILQLEMMTGRRSGPQGKVEAAGVQFW